MITGTRVRIPNPMKFGRMNDHPCRVLWSFSAPRRRVGGRDVSTVVNMRLSPGACVGGKWGAGGRGDLRRRAGSAVQDLVLRAVLRVLDGRVDALAVAEDGRVQLTEQGVDLGGVLRDRVL